MGNLQLMRFWCFVALFALILLAGVAAAQYPYSLLPADPAAAFEIRGLPAQNLQIVAVEGQPFSWAWRLYTPPNPQTHAWDFRLYAEGAAPVQRGDTVLAVFWMRALRGPEGRGYVRFIVERNREPWTKSASWTVSAKGQWQKFELPFRMQERYQPGEYSIQFWITFEEQEIEIGGLSVMDYGPDVDLSDLPLTEGPYPGHEPDAPWRAEAAARIEKYRKAELVVVARDDEGNPVAGAPVRVRMKRHAFRFGTAVAAALINDPSQQMYRQKILELFNTVVIENALKWPMWEKDRQRALNALQWLRANGIDRVRGHNILWPSWRHMPDWVEDLKNDPEALRRAVRERVTDVVTATRGMLIDWDVVNEPYTNHDLMDILGEEEMAEWFRLARQADPDVYLYLNDYNILTNGGNDKPHQDGYARYISLLDSLGAPLDGIGLQSHFGTQLTAPERVLEVLDRFAAFNKQLLITEFDVQVLDEQLQADYLRDFLTVTFSHPAVKGFYMWGFWEGRHWKPEAAMYRQDWTPKPNAEVWNDLVYRQWWTDVEGVTGPDGVFRTRGFLGDYEIEVNGRTVELTTSPDRAPNYVVSGKAAPGEFHPEWVVNAASFQAGPVAPGEIVTIYGTGFGAPELALAQYEDGRLQTWAGDTRVWFDGVASPMVYSLAGQISAVVPYGVSGQTRIEVEYLGTKTAAVTVPVADAAPGIFTYSGGTGQAVVVNQDTSFNSAENPARRGEIITLFLTGEGAVAPAIEDGALPQPGAWPEPYRALGVYIQGLKCEVLFKGLIYPGVTQLNVRVPKGVPAGPAIPIQVLVAGVASQDGVTVAIAE